MPGVGEVWVDTQFERVTNQRDVNGALKPGTITVVDAATFKVEREINGKRANGMWNNPHNMWANFSLSSVYNGNWFGQWINKIDRANGRILNSITVGEAPTHIVTIPTVGPETEVLTVPLSADDKMMKVRDEASGLKIIDSASTGEGKTHPHGHGSPVAPAIGRLRLTRLRESALPVSSVSWIQRVARSSASLSKIPTIH